MIENYEKFAKAYSDRAPTKAHNALYERPATLSLLPDLQGKRVLDAGCGPGINSKILADRGAKVQGFDGSATMIAEAQKRMPDGDFRVHDFREPLPYDGGFHVVLAALVMHYIRDWSPVLNEVRRVLQPGGAFVFSTGHPLTDMEYFEPQDYFAQDEVGSYWGGFGEKVWVSFYRRPMSAIVNSIADAGFRIDRMLEPQPLPEFKSQLPNDYEKALKFPQFLCIRALTEN